ncbi:hypothetical protein [Microvirga sp. G4-2]|uniref:hypothetical protein n=1 Tax=Microvirga sp. G4-2 TaxID=3434467 RepID=UPI00404514B1
MDRNPSRSAHLTWPAPEARWNEGRAKDLIKDLMWRNPAPDDGGKISRMTAALTTGFSIIRLLAVLMIVAMIGSLPVSAHGAGVLNATHHVHAASSHDCCDLEPAVPHGHCGLACAQASCGWTLFAAMAGWPAPLDRLPVQWKTASILPDDITPETATPPPRA